MADDDEESVNLATIEKVMDDDAGIADSDVLLMIHHHDRRIPVTRKAKKSMEIAIETSSNQPNYFFKAHYVLRAVCDILDMELVDYSFRDGANENAVFDWKKAVPGRQLTYPKSVDPSKEEFDEVKEVYNLSLIHI